MDTGRNRSVAVPSLGKALLGALLLAAISASATLQHLDREASDARAEDALAQALLQGLERGDSPARARAWLEDRPAGHRLLRRALQRAEVRAGYARAWSSPAALRAAATAYARAPADGDLAFLAERATLRWALGEKDPQAARALARAAPAEGLDPARWLAQPAGRAAALAAWSALRRGEAEAAFQALARAPAALRLELALAGFALAEDDAGRQTWINRGLQHAVGSPLPLTPPLVWRFNHARAAHAGLPAGAWPQSFDAAAHLLAGELLLREDPELAAEHFAHAGNPRDGFPLAVVASDGAPRVVFLAHAAALGEARAWAAAGRQRAAAAAAERARAWAALGSR